MTKIAILSAAAFIAALGSMFVLACALHWTARRKAGFITYFSPLVYFVAALAMLVSQRDLSLPPGSLESFAPVRPAILIWTTRLVSMLLVLAAVERIVSYFLAQATGAMSRADKGVPAPLILAFIVLWTTSVMLPSVLGAVPMISHEYVYTLLIGFAMLLLGHSEAELGILRARNAGVIFLVCSLVVAVLIPRLALETSYTQGLIPGLPRLAGLAPHAVMLAMIALVCLLCTWTQPYRHRLGNAAVWLLCLGVLLMAQSKTGWLSLIVCGLLMVIIRHGGSAMRWTTNQTNAIAVATIIIVMMVLATLAGGVLTLGDLSGKLQSFLLTGEGQQLTSLTGRDKIWAVAIDEWRRNPVFGYGPAMFDETYRALIGMNYATHGHNQIVDSLARAGIVGATGVVCYMICLSVYSVRYAKATGGLSLALFTFILMRGVSEVPLDLFGYAPDNIPHFLLLMLLAGQARASRAPVTESSVTGSPLISRRVEPTLNAGTAYEGGD